MSAAAFFSATPTFQYSSGQAYVARDFLDLADGVSIRRPRRASNRDQNYEKQRFLQHSCRLRCLCLHHDKSVAYEQQ